MREVPTHRHARLTSEKAGATSLRWRFHSSPSDATRLGPNASRILYGPIGLGKRDRAPTTSCAYHRIQHTLRARRPEPHATHLDHGRVREIQRDLARGEDIDLRTRAQNAVRRDIRDKVHSRPT